MTTPGLPRKPRATFLPGPWTMPDERVGIFIDGSNFYHALKGKFSRATVDFAKLAELLVGDRQLVRIYYYSAPYPQSHAKARDQQRFFTNLRRTPYLELRLGTLQPKAGTYIQKGVDVQLAVNMIDFAYHNTYDTAVLVSGDSDFACAVQFVKNMGKHVELAAVEGQSCFQLCAACDKTIILDASQMSQCWV